MKTRKKKVKKKAKEAEPVRDTTVVVAVGCGGIFYHGLPRMATFCNRRLKTRVVLIDPDKIEAKNASRQWGEGVGGFKVDMAGTVMAYLASASVTEREGGVGHPRDLVTMVNYDQEFIRYRERIGEEVEPYWERVVRVMVVCSPDNHLCRVNVHRGCGLLASETGVEVCEITAGNGPDYGYAYGCVHHRMRGKIDGGVIIEGKKKKDFVYAGCERDWTRYHPDIVREARAEERRLRHPASCGAMKETVPGQTMTTNQLTALCVWDLAEIMVGSNQVGEVYWTREKDPVVEGNLISVVRAKLVERE